MTMVPPFAIRPSAQEKSACCSWDTFLVGFVDAWQRWFPNSPTDAQWHAARADWRAGNTGWEAAHNAQARVKEAAEKARHDAWAAAQTGAALLKREGAR